MNGNADHRIITRAADYLDDAGQALALQTVPLFEDSRVLSLDLQDHLDWLLSQFVLDDFAKKKLELDGKFFEFPLQAEIAIT